MPWKILTYSDRLKKDRLSQLFNVKGIPTLVLVDEEGTITTDGRSQIMSVPFDELKGLRGKETKQAKGGCVIC